jgi:spermidine/putrescine transport system substrate-binding protein
VSRRALLRTIGAGAGALSLSSWLTACGSGDGSSPSVGTGSLTTTRRQGELRFANWPLYIDRLKGRRPTIDDFERATRIDVTYKEVIADNVSFWAEIRKPLAEGEPIGWDLIVLTDWLISKMIRLGYLEKLDHSRLTNFEEHAGAIYKDPIYDPGNSHSIPWQSGVTGIGYNPKLTGRKITSVNDLFSPEFRGRVGMLAEMYDTMNLTLLSLGVAPEEATVRDAEAAQKKLLRQRDDGVLHRYYSNRYADALADGELSLTMAWSGDVFQLQFDHPELEFVVPDEGAILWTDNMAIPEGAAHPIDAMEFMNFVYRPEIAAQIVGWVNYICPVPEAQQLLASRRDPYYEKVATSPLVFPTPDMQSRLHHYRRLSSDEERQWEQLFGEVVKGAGT